MKKNVILIIAMVFFFQLSQKANAAFYLEPFAGMLLSSSYESKLDEGTLSGSQVGARIGWTNTGLSLGLDGRRTSMQLKTDVSGNDDGEFTATQSGFFIGYEFPIRLRVWANYVFSSSATNDDDSDVSLTGGSGYNVGLGYKLMSFISVNLEMYSLNYETIEFSGGDSAVDFESSGMIIGISIPVSI